MTIHIDPSFRAMIDRRRAASERTISAECRFLMETGIEALRRQRTEAARNDPDRATPTADRVIEIMRTTGVGRATAISLANDERERGI